MDKQNSSRKLFLLGFFGNVAEWYDFSVYAFLAAIIGEIFFASSDPKLALIKAFFIFSASYLARPIGSICFGYFADKFGRSKSLKLSLMLMAVPAVLIGILPTYSSIGFVATICLIVLRVTQGFATGGEYPGVACYVYESAQPQRKNFFCSVAVASPAIGMFLGSSVTTIMYALLPKDAVYAWGWRIPFLLSFFVLLFVFYVRSSLKETQDFSIAQQQNIGACSRSIFQELLLHKKVFLQAVPIWVFLEVSFYLLFVWMPSYLSVFLDFAANKSFLNSSVGLLSMVAVTLAVGYFAENVQPKKIILFSILGIILLAYPLFVLLQLKSLPIVILVQLVFAIFEGCLCGVAMFTVSNLFATKIRCLGIGISVTIASGIFGGLVPTVCSYLINKTGYTLSPVFFLVTIGILALPAVLSLKPKNLITTNLTGGL